MNCLDLVTPIKHIDQLGDIYMYYVSIDRLDIVHHIWRQPMSTKPSMYAMKMAAAMGKIEILQYFYEICQIYPSTDVALAAISSATTSYRQQQQQQRRVGLDGQCVLRSLTATDEPVQNTVVRLRNVSFRYDEIIQYLVSTCHIALCAELCEAAAATGNMAALQFLKSAGCPWNRRTPLAAAANGHITCFKYAVENGCRYLWGECIRADKSPQQQVLQYWSHTHS